MNPVIGLDISKEESHGQAFLERGKPFRGTFHFEHTRDGLANFLHVLTDVESTSKQRPLLMLEATGHYQSPVVQFLEEHHYIYIVINPLISNRLRKSQLRKVKTDAADAYLLGELYYKEEFEPFKKRGRSEDWINQRVQRLLDAAKQNPFQQTMYASHLINLRALLALILQYQEHLTGLEQNIDALAEDIEEYELIQSIPGIGHKIAATILSEIGKADRFDHPKKLVAFAGIDPSVFASGKFTATRNRITIRGSRQLRYALVMAVQCGLIRSRNTRLKEFYERKRNEGKPHKVALVACANKLVHWLHPILKSKKAFRLT